jgi:hypothetical protein
VAGCFRIGAPGVADVASVTAIRDGSGVDADTRREPGAIVYTNAPGLARANGIPEIWDSAGAQGG